MQGRAWVLSALGAAVVWLGAPSVAAAQVPACDPTTAALARFTGLPEQLIHGRDYIFSLAENDSSGAGFVNSDYLVSMAENGVVFWSGTVDEIDVSIGEGKLFIRSDPGDSPLTVSAAYTEYRLDSVYPQPPECQRVIAKTMPAMSGLPLPWPRVRARFEEGQFILRTPRSCAASYAASPVAVSVKPKRSRRWTTMAVADQCAGWSGAASGRHFRLRPLGGDRSVLVFVPRTPARDSRKDFRFRVSRATVSDDGTVTLGRTLRRGVLRVTTEHYPRERVYGFKPNGEINDRYWNYCVNEGKQVWMHNGNPYCIDPAFTYREVRLRR